MPPSTASGPRSSRGSPGSSATTRRPTSPRPASATRPTSAAACRRCSRSSAGPSAARSRSFASSATCASRPPGSPPYKTRTYGLLHGVHGPAAGLYAQLTAQGLYAGTGYHQLARDQLERFRAAVVDDRTGPQLADLVAAARAGGLEVVGESLRTAPRGYPRDHPRGELLRHKALVAGRSLPGTAGIGRDEALEHVASAWRAAEPLNAWLDEHVGASTMERRLG